MDGAVGLQNPLFTGFAATDSGLVFASFDQPANAHEASGLYQLTVKDASKKLMHWSAVPGAVAVLTPDNWKEPGYFRRLYGSDGRNLVFTVLGQGHNLLWAPPVFDNKTN